MTELETVRDFLRYAVTRFSRANLYFGHGAATALDEAAFIILETLSLPIDDINPWLDARLVAAEKARLSEVIEARITTRKPTAYLLNKAYVQGVPFYVDERVIVPRSFIGEILTGEPAFLPAPTDVRTILDLCTGSGCLAILAAYSYPDADVHAVDLSADALNVARRNIADHGMEDRITLYEGDLFAPLGNRKFDLILTNPPYVDANAMAALPPEFLAEPALALAGGKDGLDIVRRILAEAPARLNNGAGLLCEFGTGREILEDEYAHLDFLWPASEEGDGEVFWLTREGFDG
ncbi:MAG: 50S ribosomal protein L3 N(5)-glutamine methyltransferase [Parvularculaceae bacterium]|nr:50S ribosomal protein L3 N(5)-glutamine methyltransferase [Parvularculaceae bacterium]